MAVAANIENFSENSNHHTDGPIDWEHLSKYTLGNKDVEKEVLELFARQSSQFVEKLRNASDAQAWKEAAHTIKGSARGIGAWRVATKAESLEMLGDHAVGAARDAAIAGLEQNLQEVLSCINETMSAE